MCVQNFNDSRSFAIRITYRISLRSSSLWEPRHPLLKVVGIGMHRTQSIRYTYFKFSLVGKGLVHSINEMYPTPLDPQPTQPKLNMPSHSQSCLIKKLKFGYVLAQSAITRTSSQQCNIT